MWAGSWCAEMDQRWCQKNALFSLVMSQMLGCLSPPPSSLHWLPVLVIKCFPVCLRPLCLPELLSCNRCCQRQATLTLSASALLKPYLHVWSTVCVCFCPVSLFSSPLPSRPLAEVSPTIWAQSSSRFLPVFPAAVVAYLGVRFRVSLKHPEAMLFVVDAV